MKSWTETTQTSKTLPKLCIRTIEHLAAQLNKSPLELVEIASEAENYYIDFERDVKGKVRELVMAKDPLAVIQRKLLDRILSRLTPSEYTYGAIKGRGALQNAKVHIKSSHIAKLDIKSFYPSVRYKKVYDFFRYNDCAPDVCRILTRLTTRKHSLPLGTSTSPMLADQILQPLDKRIAGMANKAGLKYSRYVDDITISGNYPVEKFTDLIIKIIRQQGLNIKRSKLEIFDPNDGQERIITGVAIKNGKTTAPQNYIDTLRTELLEAREQSLHQKVRGQFGTRAQYRGRIGYVMWLDKKEGEKLLKIYRKVKWRHLAWALKQRKNSRG